MLIRQRTDSATFFASSLLWDREKMRIACPTTGVVDGLVEPCNVQKGTAGLG